MFDNFKLRICIPQSITNFRPMTLYSTCIREMGIRRLEYKRDSEKACLVFQSFFRPMRRKPEYSLEALEVGEGGGDVGMI